ncbi:FAD synthetase family protein [Brucepastera parasyntrophica]|uniref:FAD synthetase family protein n=1 Tax=Brucepastera parasyntrophica TaxID=2880008 RepID=UPI00210A860D|nr:FAD synthetase family protein [Brucepastera parasyntrophica]ULQ60123.1 FAD synthetase family protein [Brucepastera parasyntrophica]
MNMTVIKWEDIFTPSGAEAVSKLCGNNGGTALTIGGFDGPHTGHQALFNAVMENAEKLNLVPGVVTFTRSPGVVKNDKNYPGDVSTLRLRLNHFAETGFKLVVLIDFSAEFGRMTGSVFFDNLVKKIRMRYVAVGPDFRCGFRLDTGETEIAGFATKEGFRVDSIPLADYNGLRISSSAVRDAIRSADFALAEKLLGYPFLLDFSGIRWEVSDKNLNTPLCSFTQILPGRGVYNAVLYTVSGTSVHVTIHVTESLLELAACKGETLPPVPEISAAEFCLSR